MSTSFLPDPRDTYFFRTPYAPEALHTCRKAVAEAYPDQPVVTILDGDGRGKDAFSLQCVKDVDAGLAPDALPVVDEWNPLKRRDIHPDDIGPSHSIQYEPEDTVFLARLIDGDKKYNGLSAKAASRAKALLGESPTDERVPLPPALINVLSPFERVDVSAPLPPEKRKQVPSVHSMQNIWAYFDGAQREHVAQNLQDTQKQGSFLVLGTTEAAMGAKEWNLDSLLQRHGYTPHGPSNKKIIGQLKSNTRLSGLSRIGALEYKIEALGPFVYQKTQEDNPT